MRAQQLSTSAYALFAALTEAHYELVGASLSQLRTVPPHDSEAAQGYLEVWISALVRIPYLPWEPDVEDSQRMCALLRADSCASHPTSNLSPSVCSKLSRMETTLNQECWPPSPACSHMRSAFWKPRCVADLPYKPPHQVGVYGRARALVLAG